MPVCDIRRSIHRQDKDYTDGHTARMTDPILNGNEGKGLNSEYIMAHYTTMA